MIRGSSLMILVLTFPRFANAQPADAGVPDTPAPAPPDPGAPAPAPGASASQPPTSAPATEEPPRITHQSPPIFPDVPKARQRPTDVQVHVEVSRSRTSFWINSVG